MSDKVFSFDLGKASIGFCVRTDENLLDLGSLIIPPEVAMTSDLRTRRRAFRTRLAHKKREKWLKQTWLKAGLNEFSSNDNFFKREFPSKGDTTLYNSACLRIALLENKPLQDWQIYKALWASIQRRGYDPDFLKHTEETDSDHEENTKRLEEYLTTLSSTFSNEQFHFPCYLEAHMLGLWSPENPSEIKPRIDHQALKIRDNKLVAPRSLVIQEVRQLFENAKKQLPQLQTITTDEFLFGPTGKPYASFKIPQYFRHRGTEWDAQGALAQKIPRFDNRIIRKCSLFTHRNTCKAQDELNQQFTLLMKLKIIKYTDEHGETQQALKVDELKQVFDDLWGNLSSKKSNDLSFIQVTKAIAKVIGSNVVWLNLIGPKEKLRINTNGRSSFCRPALRLMLDLILSGQNPPDFDITPYIQTTPIDPIGRPELEKALARLGKKWETIHIGDDREVLKNLPEIERIEAIFKTIGSVNNPIVRHRLTLFYNTLKKLSKTHGEPNKVIIEFVRGEMDLNGQKQGRDWDTFVKDNEKLNDEISQKLKDAGLVPNFKNRERLKLMEQQGCICIYTGEKLSLHQLELYQVDHIVPVSGEIVTNAQMNKVVCTREANQAKRGRTPYEWLYHSPQWAEYVQRVTQSSLPKRKQTLLTAPDANDRIQSYNGLAETAYVSKLAQKIVALHFNWGLQTEGDKRRIFASDGRATNKIASQYHLYDYLLSPEEQSNLSSSEKVKKNRKNNKHHAVDAYAMSYSQDLKLDMHPDGRPRWSVDKLNVTRAQFVERLNALYPWNVCRNKKKRYPLETIYGYKERDNKHYLTVKKNLVEYLGDKRELIKNLYDPIIQADLSRLSEETKDKQAWKVLLSDYKHPQRNVIVKRITVIKAKPEEGLIEEEDNHRFVRNQLGEFKDFGTSKDNKTKSPKYGKTFGQYKNADEYTGQILYFDSKGKVKVKPIYGHQRLETVKKALLEQGYKLYLDGLVFYSGANIIIPKDLKITNKSIPAGFYKLRTIKSKGVVIIESNNGIAFEISINYIVEAGFCIVEDNHELSVIDTQLTQERVH